MLSRALSIETSLRFRKELRQTRLKAADELYDHCVKCPNCKSSIVTSIRGDCELLPS